MEYRGDGECNCGETCTSCPADCLCDTNPPTTTIKCDNTTCSSGWYNADISITLSCSDGTGSGCDKIYYCQGQTCDLVEYLYTGPVSFNLITEGTNYVRFYSKDKAVPVNTETPTKSQIINLDKTPPTTEIK